MPYKDKEVAKKKSREKWAADLENSRTYSREYARARKAGIPWVNPVPKQRVNRKGIPVGTRVDITGIRYGKLVALEFSRFEAAPGGNGGVYFWKFKCDCGTVKEINRGSVTDGATSTCGQCRNGVFIGPEGATRRSLFNTYKRHAIRRGYMFTLEEEEFTEMTKLPCAVCGFPPSQVFKQSNNKGKAPVYFCLYTGVDRIDNSLGYETGNIRPCCKWCNMAKHAWSETQFQEWLDRVVKFRTNPESLA